MMLEWVIISTSFFVAGAAMPLAVLNVRRFLRMREDKKRCSWCNSKLAPGAKSPCKNCLAEAARDAAGPKDWPRS